MTLLTAGEIEAHDAPVPIGHGESRELARDGRLEVPERADDQPRTGAGLERAGCYAAQRRLHGFIERQPVLRVEHRRVADLDVAYAFARCIDHELARDPLE